MFGMVEETGSKPEDNVLAVDRISGPDFQDRYGQDGPIERRSCSTAHDPYATYRPSLLVGQKCIQSRCQRARIQLYHIAG